MKIIINEARTSLAIRRSDKPSHVILNSSRIAYCEPSKVLQMDISHLLVNDA